MRHGFLLVDKPRGPTSHDVVNAIRDVLHDRSVGHLGTLDPMATGLLVLAVGRRALKAVELFTHLSKEYSAQIRFGAVSSTYDAVGTLTDVPPRAGWEPPGHAELQRTIENHFLGCRDQVPPLFSAVKIGGERAYRKAMRGQNIVPSARRVEIAECVVVAYNYPELCLRVRCSAGTYIRSLAHDLGQVLCCGAHLAELRRTRVGEWSVGDACSPEDSAWAQVLPLKDVLVPLPGVSLSAEEWEEIRHGRDIAREVQPQTIAWYNELPVAILEPLRDGSRRAHPRKIL